MSAVLQQLLCSYRRALLRVSKLTRIATTTTTTTTAAAAAAAAAAQVAKGGGGAGNSGAARLRRRLEKLHAMGTLALQPGSAADSTAAGSKRTRLHRGSAPGATAGAAAAASASAAAAANAASLGAGSLNSALASSSLFNTSLTLSRRRAQNMSSLIGGLEGGIGFEGAELGGRSTVMSARMTPAQMRAMWKIVEQGGVIPGPYKL
jgi:hypothetical protein